MNELNDGGLTTAALAAAGEPTGLNQIDIPVGDASTRGRKGDPAALAMSEQAPPLFSTEETTELRARWDAIQGGFVDEPRQAVGQADSLIAGAMKRLAEMFADERAKLDRQWDRGDSVSTEDLRL